MDRARDRRNPKIHTKLNASATPPDPGPPGPLNPPPGPAAPFEGTEYDFLRDAGLLRAFEYAPLSSQSLLEYGVSSNRNGKSSGTTDIKGYAASLRWHQCEATRSLSRGDSSGLVDRADLGVCQHGDKVRALQVRPNYAVPSRTSPSSADSDLLGHFANNSARKLLAIRNLSSGNHLRPVQRSLSSMRMVSSPPAECNPPNHIVNKMTTVKESPCPQKMIPKEVQKTPEPGDSPPRKSSLPHPGNSLPLHLTNESMPVQKAFTPPKSLSTTSDRDQAAQQSGRPPEVPPADESVIERKSHMHYEMAVRRTRDSYVPRYAWETRVENRGDGEVTRMGGGESYRPSARARSPHSPLRSSTFRPDRDRSPRRERARTPLSYHSRNRSPPRRRSRTPPYRRERSPMRDNSYRARPRSPLRARSPIRARSPPRRFSPWRDDDRRERPRSPRRDERRRSRSPYDRDRAFPARARSPPPRRMSPINALRGSYHRSVSPPRRDDRHQPATMSARRPLSPSPAIRDRERSSGPTSGSTSRRSSPPIHPSRLNVTQTTAREAPRPRSPPSRVRSPPPRPRTPSNPSHDRSPPRVKSPPPSSRDRSPPVPSTASHRDRAPSTKSTPKERSPARPVVPRSPPKAPAAFRAPTGPSSSRHFPSLSPAPSVSTPVSAHNRPESSGPIIPPAGPRGYTPSARGTFSSRGGRASFGSDRQQRPDITSWSTAPPPRHIETAPKAPLRSAVTPTPPTSSAPSSAPSGPTLVSVPTGPTSIPTGPRAGPSIPSRPALQHSSTVYSSRPSQPPTPSSMRPHPAMANMPQIIPGGRVDPSATGIPADMAVRLSRRKEEEEVLREELKLKEERLRQNLKVWDRLSRESASMSLKSELSERHVRQLAGEGVGGAAF